MANKCNVSATFTGNAEEIRKIDENFKKARELGDDPVFKEKGIAGDWLGNVALVYGCNVGGYYLGNDGRIAVDSGNAGRRPHPECAGRLRREPFAGTMELVMEIEHARTAPEELLALIELSHPGVDCVFIAEEPGCDYFINTDTKQETYLFGYVVDDMNNDEYNHYETFSDVREYAMEHYGVDGETAEDLRKALADGADGYVGIHEFDISDSSFAEARFNARCMLNERQRCCRDALETAFGECYGLKRPYCLDTDEMLRRLADFRRREIEAVVAATINGSKTDGRISHRNKAWAERFGEETCQCRLRSVHPGLLDVFANKLREE